MEEGEEATMEREMRARGVEGDGNDDDMEEE